MSLLNKREEILIYIRQNISRIEYNQRIYNILEGNLLPEILASLTSQFSEKTMENIVERIAPLNLLKRIVNKLSKVYSEPCQRKPVEESKGDEELVEFYETETALDTFMGESNEYFNALKYVALQPYYEQKGDFKVPKVRVIPPHQFLTYSDDPINPLKTTIFIKFANPIQKLDKETGEYVSKRVFDLYSDEEFLSIDEDGELVSDRMESNDGVNPYSEIPFIYINRSRQEIIPQIDSDTLAMTVLLPCLLSDLNLAVKFMSHSILYGIDVEPGALDLNPNAFWIVKGTGEEGASPQLGVLKPEVDIDKVIELVKQQLAIWLETRNIKAGKAASSSNSAENLSSGISMMIQEADTTEDRKIQVGFYRDAEERLWNLFKIMHNYHFKELENKALFSKDFSIAVNFAEQRVIEDKSTKIDRISKELDAGLTSKRKSIKELNPDYSELEIDKLLEEIDAENIIEVKENPMQELDQKETKPKENKEKEKI